MKQHNLFAALLLSLSALSCTREMVQELPAPQDAQDLVTIRVTIPENGPLTKVGAHSGFSWYWVTALPS